MRALGAYFHIWQQWAACTDRNRDSDASCFVAANNAVRIMPIGTESRRPAANAIGKSICVLSRKLCTLDSGLCWLTCCFPAAHYFHVISALFFGEGEIMLKLCYNRYPPLNGWSKVTRRFSSFSHFSAWFSAFHAFWGRTNSRTILSLAVQKTLNPHKKTHRQDTMPFEPHQTYYIFNREKKVHPQTGRCEQIESIITFSDAFHRGAEKRVGRWKWANCTEPAILL